MFGRLLSALALATLAGCAEAPPKKTKAPALTTAHLLAQTACPHRIVDASAWVDHMPGPGRAAGDFHVALRFANSADTLLALKSDASTPDALIIDIRETGYAPIPGELHYTEKLGGRVYSRVAIRCRGGEIRVIPEISRVY